MGAAVTSAVDAIAQLAADNANGTVLTINELRALAESVSAASSSPNGVLYSGPLNSTTQAFEAASSVANSMGWGVIDATQRATLLNSTDFQAALQDAIQSETGLTGGELNAAVNQTLYASGATGAVDGGQSFWSQASVEYTESLTGEILTLTPNATPNGVFEVDELNAALANPDGGAINGIPRSQLIETEQTFG